MGLFISYRRAPFTKFYWRLFYLLGAVFIIAGLILTILLGVWIGPAVLYSIFLPFVGVGVLVIVLTRVISKKVKSRKPGKFILVSDTNSKQSFVNDQEQQ